MELIIGASTGGAIGAFLLVSMVTIIIIVLLWCKVTRRKRSSKEEVQTKTREEELDNSLYDVIRDVPIDTRETVSNQSLTSKLDMDMEDNAAYIKAQALSAMNPTAPTEGQLATSIATNTEVQLTDREDAASSLDEEVGVYMDMAPLRDGASSEEEAPDNYEYDYVRNL